MYIRLDANTHLVRCKSLKMNQYGYCAYYIHGSNDPNQYTVMLYSPSFDMIIKIVNINIIPDINSVDTQVCYNVTGVGKIFVLNKVYMKYCNVSSIPTVRRPNDNAIIERSCTACAVCVFIVGIIMSLAIYISYM